MISFVWMRKSNMVSLGDPSCPSYHQHLEDYFKSWTETSFSFNLSLTTELQIYQNIAKYLPADTDITRFSLVCKTTFRAVTDSVWRFRFLEKFDAVPNASPASLRTKYQFRKGTTKLYTKFDWNQYKYLGRGAGKQQEQHQRRCLEMLQSLLVGMSSCNYITWVQTLTKGHRIRCSQSPRR